MSYVPMQIDTKGEFRALGYKEIGVSDNGKWARLVFVARDMKAELPVQLAADLLDKMLPSLLGVSAECARRRTGKDIRQVFKIREGGISKAADGRIIFSFTIPGGQQFSFELDKEGASLVLESLSTVLELSESQTGKVDPPQRH